MSATWVTLAWPNLRITNSYKDRLVGTYLPYLTQSVEGLLNLFFLARLFFLLEKVHQIFSSNFSSPLPRSLMVVPLVMAEATRLMPTVTNGPEFCHEFPISNSAHPLLCGLAMLVIFSKFGNRHILIGNALHSYVLGWEF